MGHRQRFTHPAKALTVFGHSVATQARLGYLFSSRAQIGLQFNHIMRINESVDIVYLWVDGSDPTWRLKRRMAMAQDDSEGDSDLAVYGNVEGRFRDNQELRYSLRALDQYFPDHGHVYIVTDGQVPDWLVATVGVTVVDHRELIPEASLPTFDSGHIETYIHRIPNLTERYFYFNDDVFFGSPVRLSDWFWSGGVYAAWSDERDVSDEPMRQDATALENACRLSIQWLTVNVQVNQDGDIKRCVAATPYRPTFRTFAHAPRPMLRSMLFELEALAPELFAMSRSTVFRAWDKPTIVSDFVIRWALEKGVAMLRDYSHLHVSTGDDGEPLALDQLRTKVGSLHFFCINDTTDDAHLNDPRLTRVLEVLQQALPQPSRFERV